MVIRRNLKCLLKKKLHIEKDSLLLSIGKDGQLHKSLYDKRNYFNFHITNFSYLYSNIPSSPAYDVFISQLQKLYENPFSMQTK